MIVYRCDSCNTNVDTQDDLTTLTVQVKMGGIYLANLPPIDRCHKCNEGMKSTLQTMVRALDDTGTHNERTQPTINPARIDALHLVENTQERGPTEEAVDISELLEEVSESTEEYDASNRPR